MTLLRTRWGKVQKNEYFFDTYAFYEIKVGNPSYLPFTKDVKIVTTQLNLMGLYYQLLALYDKQQAVEFFRRHQEFVVPISNDIVIEAMDFRKKHYKNDLSYVDCIGYSTALENNLKFLTGDKAFKGMDNVEFVQ